MSRLSVLFGKLREPKRPLPSFVGKRDLTRGTFYKWKKRFGSMQVAEVKRLGELESENARLKRLLADRLIEIDAMQELLAKKW
jgi:putative transposase